MHTRLGRLNGIVLVVNRTGGARQVKYLVDFQIERESDVVPDDFEPGRTQQSRQVFLVACVEVVDAQDLMSSVNHSFAQVPTQKAGTTRYQNPLLSSQQRPNPLSPAFSLQLLLTKPRHEPRRRDMQSSLLMMGCSDQTEISSPILSHSICTMAGTTSSITQRVLKRPAQRR